MALFQAKPLLLNHRHTLTVVEVRNRLERAAQAARRSHNVSWHWDDATLEVLPPAGIADGARGRILVNDHTLQVEILIPLPFVAVRRRIATRLTRELDLLLQTEKAA